MAHAEQTYTRSSVHGGSRRIKALCWCLRDQRLSIGLWLPFFWLLLYYLEVVRFLKALGPLMLSIECASFVLNHDKR